MADKKKSSRFHKKHDPNRKREQALYERPIPSREYISDFLQQYERPASLRRLIEAFSLNDPDEKEGLRRRLIAMARDGQLITNRRGRYVLVSQLPLVRGRVQAHRDGYGFVIPDTGGDDVFLPARQMRAVFNDDIVLVQVIQEKNQQRKEGVLVEVLERRTQHLVGKFVTRGGVSFVDPDHKTINQSIIVVPGMEHGAQAGQLVTIEIIDPPGKRQQATGKVIEVLGDFTTQGMEMALALRAHDLPHIWPDAVHAAVELLPNSVQYEGDDRLDLRALPFITIDGEDAKDFDDAVYAEKNNDGTWSIDVAIADVSHYVQEGSALDQEAFLRGNSVYFPAAVIPMLPEALSCELCSLKSHVDRLVVVCRMRVNANGCVDTYSFSRAVIHSHARLTYTQAAEILQGGSTLSGPWKESLLTLHKAYLKMLRARKKRGALDFDAQETKVVFDDHGKIAKIVPQLRNDAHRLIEEMMLAANVCAASFILSKDIPGIYRVHEGPGAQKLQDLRTFLRDFNLRLGGGKKPAAKDYAALLDRVRTRMDAHLIETTVLRSMQQAVYSTENHGHFGLSYDAYTHFTSPIRRYADLCVHRAITKLITHKKNSAAAVPHKEDLQSIADHCSMTERRADRASRDALDWLKCEYMQDKCGQTFNGSIVEVTGFGFFVELSDIYVHGLVHVATLKNDYYHFDSVKRELSARHGHQCYRLGDVVTVLVARVDLDERQIDFELMPLHSE